MPAYLVARIQVTDWEQYTDYMKVTPDAIAKHGGRFLSRGGESITLEGPEETHRIVLVEFPSMEQAKRFYESPEYTAARKLREGAAEALMAVVDGIA